MSQIHNEVSAAIVAGAYPSGAEPVKTASYAGRPTDPPVGELMPVGDMLLPMMTDMRSSVSNVPLGMLVHNDYRAERMVMAFYLSGNWSRPCYLCDAETGEKLLITDGLLVEVEMPEDYSERYYIEGPDPYNSGDGVITSTTNPIEQGEIGTKTVVAYASGMGQLTVESTDLMREVKVYDMLGGLAASRVMSLYANSITMDVPKGLYVVDVTWLDGTTRCVQALVR